MPRLKTLRVHKRQFLATDRDFNAISYNEGSENIAYSLTTYDLISAIAKSLAASLRAKASKSQATLIIVLVDV